MKPPLTSAPPTELVRRLCRTWEAVQPVIARSLAAQGLDGRVQAGMGLVLFALFEQDGQPIRDIARRGHVSHVAVLRLARRMEIRGLVACRDCPDDGRSTRVWLTPSGRALEGRLRAVSRRNHETLTRILGAKDAIRLNDLLGRLLDGLDAGIGNGPRLRSRQKAASRRGGRAAKATSSLPRRP
ncbi:MAG: MarR family transcriptional regulator [Limisphaerales bacterium]